MRHVASGRLSLDESAAPHVDAMLKAADYPYNVSRLFAADRWSLPPPHEYDAKDVTIRHLLHMTSGVEDYDTEAYRHLQYSHAAVDFSPARFAQLCPRAAHVLSRAGRFRHGQATTRWGPSRVRRSQPRFLCTCCDR